VWIGYPIGSSRVHPIFTNREAHVAMFEIIPGRGATMVYPRGRTDGFASEAHYADLAIQYGRMFYYTDPFGHANFQPRYYYAVASVAPLNLARLQASLGATRRVLGQLYASYRPYDVIDRLTEVVVPMPRDEDWATDLFVDWPAPPTPRFLADRLVRCANGRVIQAASNYPYYGCPGDAALTVAADAPKPPPKEATLDGPRAPRRGAGRNGVELAAPGVDKRRRAEAGAPPPRVGGRTRSPSERIRYADEDRATRSRGTSSRGARSRDAGSSTTQSSGGSRSVERSEPVSKPAPERRETASKPAPERREPVSKPAPERRESGTERKP
jgi:hypothetical protein